ncbi:MAG: DUF2497 domain-containing protein [Alphaproteobacteria bacterium]|nr:DUF2497 domain-containing protein [Alphaproteobacteria bacterium]
MSASNAAAEPSMEEILSSIRQAINEDIPGAVPENAGDPFASGSSAEAAFSAPPPGQAFDAAVHESHDPFAELTRKLNETRESVQKQMHGVSSNLRSDPPASAPEERFQTEAQPAPPPPVKAEAPAPTPEPPTLAPWEAAAPAPEIEEPKSIRAAIFSAAPQETPPGETADAAAAAGALQALTARVADQQKTPVEPPKPAPEPVPTPAPEVAEAPAAKPASALASISEGTAISPMPELSWASADRSAPTQSAALEKPEFIKPASFDKPAPSAPETAPVAKPKTDTDPFPKLTAMVERGITESAGSVKTDDAMADLVLRRILEPAIRSWLDDNLPDIVTEIVRDEVRRVASQSI